MHYALFYRFVKDSKTVKQPFRSAHLRYAWEASARGELILGGVLSDPEDEALLLFTGDSPEIAENFASKDPYVLNGIVTQWQVRPWTTVVGKTAATPVQPD